MKIINNPLLLKSIKLAFAVKNLLSTLVLTLFVGSNLHAQYTDQINSNRPGKSVSAFSVGKAVYQLEAGYNIWSLRDKPTDYSSTGRLYDINIRFGQFFEELEFDIDLQYQKDHEVTPLTFNERSGLKQSTFGAKYLVYDPFKKFSKKKPNLLSWTKNHKRSWKEIIPAVSIYAGFNLSFGNNPYTFPKDKSFSPKLVAVMQHHLGSSYVLITNVFADKIATNFPSFGGIMTLTRGFNDNWSGMIEWQSYIGDFYNDNILRVGAAYLVHDDLQIDANFNRSLKSTPELMYGGVGLSWRFDGNLGIHWTRVDKPKKDKIEDKKGKSKKKDKDKKGKDKKSKDKKESKADKPTSP
ncbi:MAG: hypothetical protein CFE24_03975 [Flavobacterium sp. BFFFF2]|nr:MAG: hypothetical protein CFE24_03975 [Flavobacterium sp. BFFFF2]